MIETDPIAIARTPDNGLSRGALYRIGHLLAGLDQLDAILSLPSHPQSAEPRIPFARFQLRARIGAGSYGIVLLADDPQLGRQVVVKVPLPAILADAVARERFVREARAAAVLDHPGIVPVYDAGELNGLPYLVAGLVDGPTLAARLAEQKSFAPPADSASLVRDLARAVHHAHERGILHCDLKPGNVLLPRPRGAELPSPVVTDFGLARVLNDDPALTRTFGLTGTPLYMSPEQARGDRRALTARTDVYSLGVILFEMLTGRRPFELEQGPDILARVQTESPPCPRSINAKVPRDLRAVCLKCLAKEPADRYASAAALADDLDRYLAGRPVEARPVSLGVRALRWARRRPVEAAALAFAFLVSAAAVGIAADRWVRDVESRARLKTEEAESDAAEEKARTADMTSTLASTLMSVRERRAARSAEWASTNLEELRGLAALAVGKNAVGILRNEAAAALAAIDLGTPRAIAQGFKTYALAFTPDGRELALASWFAVPEESRTCVVRIVDPATGRVVRELRYPSNAAWEFRYGKLHLDGSRSITYSPDGRWLVVGTRSQCLVRWDLHETNPKATRWLHCPETVGIGAFPMTVHVDQVAFDDRGRLLSGNEGRQVVVWDAPNDWKALSRKSGEPGLHLARPSGPALATTHPLLEPVNPWIHAVALEGTLSMERSKLVWNRHVLVDHTNGRDLFELASQEHLATDVGTVTDAVFSPDGQLLVTTAEHQGHLKLWDTLSGRLLASRKLPKGSQRTAFCPDGKSLAVATEGHVLLYGIHRPRVTDVVGFQRSLIHDANLDAARQTLLIGSHHGPATDFWACDVSRHTGPARTLTHFDRAHHWDVEDRFIGISRDGQTVATFAGQEVATYHMPSKRWEKIGSLRRVDELEFTLSGILWGRSAGGITRWANGVELSASSEPTLRCFAVSDDGAVVGREDGALCFHGNDVRVEKTLPLSKAALTAVDRRGERIVVGTEEGDVILLQSDRVVATLRSAQTNRIDAIAIGPHGYFATGSLDHNVRIWSPDGAPVLTLPQTRAVRRLFWAAEGRQLLILADKELGLRRWHLDELKKELSALGIEPGLP